MDGEIIIMSNLTIKEQCIEVAANALHGKGYNHLNPTDQVENIFSYGAIDSKFAEVTTSKDARVQADLKAQIKYICSLGLDTAKGRKLVYVRTRNVNTAPRNAPKVWLTFPDISESYHALIHVLVRSNALKNIVVQHVYDSYPVEYSGNISDVPVIKSWSVKPQDRGAYTGCFITLYLSDGDIQTSFYHFSDIIKTHKEFSKSSGTWRAHEQSMVAKSAIMEAIRYIPVFDDVVASVVEHYDESHDYDKQVPVSENQVSNIVAMVDESNIDLSILLKKYAVESIEELPGIKYESCINTIKEFIERAA